MSRVPCRASDQIFYILPPHRTIHFTSQYLHDATFTTIWANILLDVTSPCISIYRDTIFTTNVPCRPVIWVTRLLCLYITLGGCKDIHMDVTWPLVITSQLTLLWRVLIFNYNLSQYQLGLTIVPPPTPPPTSKRLHHVACPVPWFLFVICYLAHGMWILLIGCQYLSSAIYC